MKRGWLDQEMSFSRAAAELSRDNDPLGRKLRNLVMARERELGKRIAIRLSDGPEPKLRVTIGAIYRHLPELRPARIDDLARLVRPMLERQEERHESRTRSLIQAENDRTVFPRLESAENRLEKVEKRAASIARCLRELHDIDVEELSGTAKN